MQPRIDGDESVDRGRQERCEGGRSDRLALPEALILAHVGKIRGDKANAARPKVSGRCGGEDQRQEYRIGRLSVQTRITGRPEGPVWKRR